MSFSVARLTLFAIITSIETDLREISSVYLGLRTDIEKVLGPNLSKNALEKYEKDFDPRTNPPTIDQLLNYLDFSDTYQVINANAKDVAKGIAKYIKSITPALERLVSIRNRVMHSRPLQFDDFAVTVDTAERLQKSQDYPWKNLKLTLTQLEQDPSFVLNLEIPSYSEEKRKHNLPIPDFDETGFLGRKQQASDLLKHCLGPYPVISLVGDGGIGKTALALKVAYDLLDMPDCPFEAIVYSSAKTTQLTAQEIQRIEGAISDSLGIFNNITVQLAGTKVNNPVDEIIDYLKTFKILLIIDNLETVLDEKIRRFLEMLPLGSKVLITSRIGIGAFEYPQKLQAMDQSDAVDLLRAIARVRGVTDLVRLDSTKLIDYCRRMRFNPGFIKWFVAAVQTGMRPEEVLSKPDVFLDFCMSNVYKYLSQQGTTVLRSMLCLPGKHSLAELAFLNEIEAIDLQSAIYELLRTNMVFMSSTAKGSSFESQYDISELARTYLSRHHPVESKEFEKLARRKRQLVAAGEEIQAERKIDPYSFYSLTMRSRSDVIVAKYLVDALKKADSRNFSSAEALVQKARNLAPEYFEVHRVEAIVKTLQGDYSAAYSAYEAAIEIEPLSAPLHKWFGGFLMRYMNDTEGALTQFRKAAELDNNALEVKLEMARALLYLREFEPATLVVQELINKIDTRKQNARKVFDIYLQCFYRRADYLITERLYAEAVAQLEKLRSAYEMCPVTIRDSRIKEKIANAVSLARLCFQLPDNQDIDTRTRAQTLARWFANEVDMPHAYLSTNEVKKGIVKSLPAYQQFGFIRAENDKEFFFHRSEMKNPNEWPLLTVGTRVVFITGHDRKGSRAISVDIEDTNRQSGTIVSLPPAQEYGFIRTTKGHEYYFHFKSILAPEAAKPNVGAKVKFTLGENTLGPCAVDVTIE